MAVYVTLQFFHYDKQSFSDARESFKILIPQEMKHIIWKTLIYNHQHKHLQYERATHTRIICGSTDL